MKRLFLFSLKNVQKNPGRSMLLALCVAVLTALQAGSSIVDLSTRSALEKGLSRLGADLMIVPKTFDASCVRAYMTGKPATYTMPADIVEGLRQFSFIDLISPQLYIQSLSGASCCSAWNVFLIAFDPATDFTVRPWLRKDTKTLTSSDILCGAGINMPVGSTVKFYGETFRIAATLEPGGMGLDSSIFIPMESARRMIENSKHRAEKPLDIKPGDVSALLIRLKSGPGENVPVWKAAYEIEQRFGNVTVVRPGDITRKAKGNLEHMLSMTSLVVFTLWPMSALLTALVFAMIVSERRREIGLLYALGATRLHIFSIIEIEAAIIALSGAALGAAISWGGTALFSHMISFKLEVPVSSSMFAGAAYISAKSIALAAIIGCLAAFLPALRATMLEPYEAIRR